MDERGGPDTIPWPEEAVGEKVSEALDRYEEKLSARMNKEVRLKDTFRERVRDVYILEEDEAEQNAAALVEADRDRVACPICADASTEVAARGLDHSIDPSLRSRAYPVTQGEGESREAVLARVRDRPMDTVAEANPDGYGTGTEGYRQLCEGDVLEGLMYRDMDCGTHDGVAIAMVKEGEARLEDGTLTPFLAPE